MKIEPKKTFLHCSPLNYTPNFSNFTRKSRNYTCISKEHQNICAKKFISDSLRCVMPREFNIFCMKMEILNVFCENIGIMHQICTNIKILIYKQQVTHLVVKTKQNKTMQSHRMNSICLDRIHCVSPHFFSFLFATTNRRINSGQVKIFFFFFNFNHCFKYSIA